MPRLNPTSNIIVHLHKYFLIFFLVFFLSFLLYFISPFLGTVIIAAVIAAGSYPIQGRLLRASPNHPTLMTFLSLLIITVIFLTPLTFLLTIIAEEAGQAYGVVSVNLDAFFSQDFTLLPAKIQQSFIGRWFESVQAYAPLSMADIIRNLQDAISRLSSFVVSQTTNVLKQFSLILLHLILFFLAFFYFLRDGNKVIAYIRSLLPLPTQYRDELFRKLSTLSRSILYGVFGAAVAQGFLAGLGFYFAGVSNVAFWGMIMAFFSPIPYIGTTIIWVPTVIYMFVQGAFWPAVFLFFWCAVIVGFSDNIVKPYLIGGANAIHPLLVLLVILGGVFVFGLKGVIFGPFLLTLTLTFLHIYQLEYKAILEE